MNALEHTPSDPALASWLWLCRTDNDHHRQTDVALHQEKVPAASMATGLMRPGHLSSRPGVDILQPLRQWLDNFDIHSAKLAHQICRLIPSQCPFERDIKFWGRTLFHIPPMCKLNPLYEQVVGLRFRALCYLADECGEDVTPYC